MKTKIQLYFIFLIFLVSHVPFFSLYPWVYDQHIIQKKILWHNLLSLYFSFLKSQWILSLSFVDIFYWHWSLLYKNLNFSPSPLLSILANVTAWTMKQKMKTYLNPALAVRSMTMSFQIHYWFLFQTLIK